MSEVNEAVLVNDNFNPLEVLLEHSKIWKISTGYEPLGQCHPKNDLQTQAGFKCHEVFLFKNGFCCWIYAVIDQRASDATEADTLTENSLFNVNLTVKVKNGDDWLKCTKPYKDVAVVDVVMCKVNNGTRAFVGVLCLLVEFKWYKVQYTNNNTRSHKWFERPPEEIQAGLTIERTSEFNPNNMPFRYSDVGSDEGYIMASEYAFRKSAQANRFFRVNLVERSSPDLKKSLVLFSDLYIRKGESGKIYIRLMIMNSDYKWPMTTNTPLTMDLTIKKGTEKEKWKAKPYHAEIIAFNPWAVHVVSGNSLAFLGVSLPIRDAYEAQFFEEAFEDMASVEVKYSLTRQSLD
ncbi:hypothetical protein TMatcc_010221 [Talaromyces marneffei ATCC 18224]|uniref:Uncharacterized protein n=2 Tax=Talaromyces marneffei TaxID=37727 RepID=B6QW96_TALMQ|nr:uncharacterized protein EYB26_009972 [Talaromyces marneffei]EEA19224.1 hypothetical protein PMAA_014840 [Talaromyces marneffei ATCC 18224]KAE8548915.1 hypothetical protein EYB25_009298 [Talaromyces marneffei]QGA22256.1 hypothetical protein EYB26_009972 [Talaromyces marneffei]